MVFKPIPDRTRWEGLMVAAWILLGDGLLLVWALRRPTDWLKFMLLVVIVLSLPVLAYVLYRTWAAFTLEYWVDRNAVTIRWAHVRQVVPVHMIQRIIEEGVAEAGRVRWYHWPLPWVRPTYSVEFPDLMLCATRPPTNCLLLDTGNTVFAVSPRWRARFIEQLQASYQLGPALSLRADELEPARTRRWLRENGVGVALLALGLIGVLALFGRLMVTFPSLPSSLPFRYNSEGLPEVLRDKGALFIIPAVGLLSWLTNSLWGIWMVLRKQPTGAYMLWGGAIIVQIFSLMALNSLLP